MANSMHGCGGCRQFAQTAAVSRREALRVGGLFGMGLTLPSLLQSRAAATSDERSTFGRAKQVISLFLHGGHPQQETFDPKLLAPIEYRGP